MRQYEHLKTTIDRSFVVVHGSGKLDGFPKCMFPECHALCLFLLDLNGSPQTVTACVGGRLNADRDQQSLFKERNDMSHAELKA